MPGGRPNKGASAKRTRMQAATEALREQRARQQTGEGKARAGSTATTASYSGAPSSRAAKAASGAPMVTRSKVPHGGAQGRPMGDADNRTVAGDQGCHGGRQPPPCG